MARKKNSMQKRSIDIEIIRPGRPTAQYQFLADGSIKLERVIYPDVCVPYDLAFLPKTMTDAGSPLPVILLGEISHPPQTQVSARLLGAFKVDADETYFLAVPDTDSQFSDLERYGDIPEILREDLVSQIKKTTPGDGNFFWLDMSSAELQLKDAYLHYRKARLDTYAGKSHPAWKPVEKLNRLADYLETDHFTEAEYTYFELPYHIQYYVGRFLHNDERVLYAVHRPAMKSARKRTWLNRETLQEGVLILTNQRLVYLVELLPPGSSGVRYGYHVHLGVLEKLAGVEIKTINSERLLIRTQWQSTLGVEQLEWEFPIDAQPRLYEISKFLKGFIPGDPFAIQRATLPAHPDNLPRLRDPAANDPEDLTPVNERFKCALDSMMQPGEILFDWALWPAWFASKKIASALIVTNQRLLVAPDPAVDDSLKLDLPLKQFTSMEFVESILESNICVHRIDAEGLHQHTLMFPYPAVTAFRQCFDAIIRYLAIIPLQ
jgi:inorganic pyrophosphatase